MTPICIPSDLPAKKILESENIFVMDAKRAQTQDIRPLKAVIVNLMPTKIATETQLLRLIGGSPLQIEVEFLETATYESKNTPAEHLERFYTTFDSIKNNFYDMMIITGAPVETLEFTEVAYWDEICSIFDWAKRHVCSTMYICWAAQAALYRFYGINKYPLDKKKFGVFKSAVKSKVCPLTRGFNDVYFVPHSHHTEVRSEDILKLLDHLELICESDEAGPDIAADSDLRNIFVFGHCEYDAETLQNEYLRDIAAKKEIAVPVNYFRNGDPSLPPENVWRGHANLLYLNWINHVYQMTPFNLSEGFGNI